MRLIIRMTNLRKVVLLFTASAVGLLLCEGITRVMHLAPQVERINPGVEPTPYRLSDNPVLGYVYKENYRGAHGSFFSWNLMHINGHGFKDVERACEKREGTPRIIMLGDSVVVSGPTLDDTIPGNLERLLKPQNIEVLNFGVNGYCTRAEVEMLKERGLKFAPDLVVVVFVNNDYRNLNDDLGFAAERLPPLVELAFLHSHLFRLASLRWNWHNLRLRTGIDDIAGHFLGPIEADHQLVKQIKESKGIGHQRLKQHLIAIGENNVADGLKSLRDLAARHGFEVMIAIWPTFRGNEILDYETAEPGKAQLLPESQPLFIEQLAAANDFFCFRLSPFFRDDAQRVVQQGQIKGLTLQEYYTADSMHPVPAGARVAAAGIQQMVLQHFTPFQGRKPSQVK